MDNMTWWFLILTTFAIGLSVFVSVSLRRVQNRRKGPPNPRPPAPPLTEWTGSGTGLTPKTDLVRIADALEKIAENTKQRPWTGGPL